MSVHILKGVVQPYAWGGTDFIPDLLQINNPDQLPFAEYWMGTHIKGTAVLQNEQGEIALTAYIQNNPTKVLGNDTARTFDNKLPFLFKVLDVNRMLSIQAHPTKAVAKAGFIKENRTGIEVTAPNRTYRDDNHKPEIMVALTDFWLLHGFRSKEAIQEVLKIPEFIPLQSYYEGRNIYDLYRYIMTMPQEVVDQLLEPLWERLRPLWEAGSLEKDNPDYWAAQAFVDYTRNGHYDRGIFSIYLFNLVHIPEGFGIFQAAGIPHAYLEGANMELMANSDNVFRGGLTPKHIDVPELLKNLVFEPMTPVILSGKPINNFEKVYPSPVLDFELSKISLTIGSSYTNTAHSAEIIIVMEGAITVLFDNKTLDLFKGKVIFVDANTEYQLRAEDKGSILYKAKVPVAGL